MSKCYEMGGDVAKVAVLNNSTQDAASVLSLYAASNDDDDRETTTKKRKTQSSSSSREVVALGMGRHGKITRVSCLSLGSPFTFCAATKETCTAPGQLTLEAMLSIRKELDD